MANAGLVSILGLANTPNIQNVLVQLANSEIAVALPASTRRLMIKARGNSQIQFSFIPTGSSTQYITISPGAVYSESELDLSGVTIYLQTNHAAQVVEILSWSRI